jgi:hypothetical protein
VQNFYSLLAASDEKVHDGTDVTILQVVTSLMAMKSKYNFLYQRYNDIIKLIIDLIPVKHNMPKVLYQSKKIVAGLGMNYEKIDVCEKLHVVLEGVQGQHRIYVSVFSAPANYGVVNIARSSSMVVLRTMKHTMIYPGSDPSSEVIALCPMVWYLI